MPYKIFDADRSGRVHLNGPDISTERELRDVILLAVKSAAQEDKPVVRINWITLNAESPSRQESFVRFIDQMIWDMGVEKRIGQKAADILFDCSWSGVGNHSIMPTPKHWMLTLWIA
ncbi:MAG: hypothetical protein WCV82_01355 [Candidatus Paceibacterota bacterium]